MLQSLVDPCCRKSDRGGGLHKVHCKVSTREHRLLTVSMDSMGHGRVGVAGVALVDIAPTVYPEVLVSFNLEQYGRKEKLKKNLRCSDLSQEKHSSDSVYLQQETNTVVGLHPRPWGPRKISDPIR